MDIKSKIDRKQAKQELNALGGKLRDESIESFVSLRHIDKVYPNGVQAVFDFNLEVNKHDFVALVGPSGCGKSTTLRMIAGLEDITSGELFIDKVYSNYLPSKDRDIAMVFQNYALYPQMNVFDNIAFGLKIRHVPKAEIEERVYKAADILGLGPYLDRKPKELSGGQMQRVALGRAIVRQSNLFLMDEPLSNLDAKLRVQMRSEIVRIHREVGATTIYVTHDQTEAMTMANLIVCMNKGVIQQAGTSLDLYDHPANLFVATFIGSPAMNILRGNLSGGKLSIQGLPDVEVDGALAMEARNKALGKLVEIKGYLDNSDSLTVSALSRMESAQIYVKKEEIAKPKKKGIALLSKLRELGKKKIDPLQQRKQEALSRLSEMAEEYQRMIEQGTYEVAIGLRPEAFRLEGDSRASKPSEAFELPYGLVEVLGSELIIHLQAQGKEIQMRTEGGQLKENKGSLRLCFDIGAIHLFDLLSGERIGF